MQVILQYVTENESSSTWCIKINAQSTHAGLGYACPILNIQN